MQCPRCGRTHNGICGIPRSPMRINSGFNVGGIVSTDTLAERFSANLARADERLAEGKYMIEAKINKLREALDGIVAEINAGADESLSREEELLRRAIQRLVESL